MPCTDGSSTRPWTTASTSACVASAPSVSLRDTMPASAAFLCLELTYRCDGLSSPTSTVARHTAGLPIRSISAARLATSSLRRRLPFILIAPPGVRSMGLPSIRRSSLIAVWILQMFETRHASVASTWLNVNMCTPSTPSSRLASDNGTSRSFGSYDGDVIILAMAALFFLK